MTVSEPPLPAELLLSWFVCTAEDSGFRSLRVLVVFRVRLELRMSFAAIGTCIVWGF